MIKLQLVRFTNFRQRLLFWFLVFLSSNLILIALSYGYLNRRNKIAETVTSIEAANDVFLKSTLAQQYFLSYGTKSHDFFQSSNNEYLDKYNQLKDSTFQMINKIDKVYPEFQLSLGINSLKKELIVINSIFQELVEKVQQRGFKDYSLEGSMRVDAHWLEAIKEVPTEKILSLRRHEKDYIIRNQLSYQKKLNALAEELKLEIHASATIPRAKKDSIVSRLSNYQEKFNQIVELDQISGIKDNSGLKLALDQRIQILESQFDHLIHQANIRKGKLFVRLNSLFGGIIAIFFIGSILLSSLIAKRITKPLTDLTVFITRFIDSNFTLSSSTPMIRSKDEIGKLTQNFTILKEEIITRLRFFKQKVEERTQELARANEQLKRVNEANSRFVPNEFLRFLGKSSIEEVKLGDHIEGEMTIMFTDIRSFTKISEKLSPQDNFDFINNYLNNIVPIIQKYNGIIDKYIGDSIMALFPEGADLALQAAHEFESALDHFNVLQLKKGQDLVQIGVGIHTGRMILGTIGHNQRLETTVISDAVNIAARVEGLTKDYHAKIIATDAVLKLIKPSHNFDYRFLGQVKVKGKSETIGIYEFLSKNDIQKLSYQQDYEKGLDLLEALNFKDAKILFTSLFQKNPADKAVELMLQKSIQQDNIPNDQK